MTIAWAASKSPKADKIYCAPGNAGIAEFAECIDMEPWKFDKLAAFAKVKRDRPYDTSEWMTLW